MRGIAQRLPIPFHYNHLGAELHNFVRAELPCAAAGGRLPIAVESSRRGTYPIEINRQIGVYAAVFALGVVSRHVRHLLERAPARTP
jgi:hypothetical protein